MKDRAKAVELGFCGAELRSNQLPMNRSTTTTFTPPCMSPIFFARVPEGMAHQSPIRRPADHNQSGCNHPIGKFQTRKHRS